MRAKSSGIELSSAYDQQDGEGDQHEAEAHGNGGADAQAGKQNLAGGFGHKLIVFLV
jgi:hypothetical protein